MDLNDIAKEARQRDLADISKLMDSAEGRRVLHRIIDFAQVFAVPSSFDPQVLAAHTGQRNIGLMVFSDIMEAAPKKFQVMMFEAKERRQARQAKEQAALKAKAEENQ